MSIPKITPISKDQWSKVLTALGFSFVSTFVSVFMAGGGIQSTSEATFALATSALVSAVNATLYGITRLFVDDSGIPMVNNKG